ncbi:MAG TPA: sigma 54-interacting transcriptional regulator [Candidatus Binataceae bacterium]|nr:sigma 54-interacting transcriptional regulator [Candidatus Binataceae bacterium]
MEPFARVSVGKGAPAEFAHLLATIGLEPLPERNRRLADLAVEFGGEIPADNREIPVVRLAISNAPGAAGLADFDSTSVHAAACFVLSRALHLSAPFLTAEAGVFEVVRLVLTLTRGPARLVIEGETGTGKQALIRIVLAAAGSGRTVRIDCASFDEAAADKEFSAAIKALAGDSSNAMSDEAAHGGILFLNRVDELPLSAQRRLLSEIHSAPVIRPRIRYLATSTRALGDLTARGLFVAELYNLFEVALTLAPLRERPADVEMLAWYFLRKANPALALSAGALKTLSDYPFPGNVRELQNVITRLAIVPLASDSSIISRPDILGQLATTSTGRLRTIPQMGRTTARIHPRAVTIGPGSPAAERGKGNSPVRLAPSIRRRPKPPNGPRIG